MSPFDPSDEEAQAARTGIQFHQGEIASLDAKIATLLGIISTLREMKEEHEDQLRRCESVLILARRLPPELLGQIFEDCVEVQPSAPIILSQVCAAWRVAARNSPRIWSRLVIDCSRPRAAAKVAYWLHMSGSHIPLRIKLFPHDISLRPVMAFLLAHAARWQNFTVDAVLPAHASEILETIRTSGCSLSNMGTVEFIVHDEIEGTLDFRGVFNSSTCPQLYTVGLQSDSWSRTNLPAQITVLNLVVPVLWLPTQILSQTIDLLHGLPGLQSFALEFPDGSFPRETIEPIGDVTLAMDHLHTVILTGCHPIFDILPYLILPSLRHLGLRETGRDFPQPPNSIGPSCLRMIERSSPPIETLELHGIEATDNDFIRCFMQLPTLASLTLHESEVSDGVFRLFCTPVPNENPVHDSPSWICPNLNRLDLRWCSQLSGRVLLELVEARLTAPESSPISEVVLINCSSVREEDVLSIAALTVCRLKNRPGDFCYRRGCCINKRYRYRLMLRHAAELRQERNGVGRLEL